jgi:thymidylate synthase
MYEGTFGKVYKDVLEEILLFGEIRSSRIGKTLENRNIMYTVNKESTESIFRYDDEFDDFPSELKRPSLEYAHAFSDWVLSGETVMPERLKELSPASAKFDANQSDLSTFELPQNFSMFYGPRIHAQFHQIALELLEKRDTRRAFLQILDGMNDNKLLSGLREGELPTVEYPCTIGFLFDVNKYEELNVTVFMRSQNMVTVWPYDYLIALKLLHKMAGATGLKVGTITGIVASAHVYERDFEFACELTNTDIGDLTD